jgi:ZIP family zinc transporter
MLTLSLGDLFLPHAATHGLSPALAVAAVGAGLVLALDAGLSALGLADADDAAQWLPAPAGAGAAGSSTSSGDAAGTAAALQAARSRRRSAMLTTLALAAHNAPEGLAVGLTAMAGGHDGNTARLSLVTLSIAVHNLPEGLAVAAAIYNVTGNRTQAVVIGLGGGARGRDLLGLSCSWRA